MKYKDMLEEELKNKVAKDFFARYDCTKILSKIDFSVCVPSGSVHGDQFFLWAEAKAVKTDVCDMLAQLVLTIGKAKTFNELLPPPFLGCFDIQNIVFIPYSEIQEIFYINDFNWNIAPSDRTTAEFAQVRKMIDDIIMPAGQSTLFDSPTLMFDFERDEAELKAFIKENFVLGNVAFNKIRIDKNNFIFVYNKWLEQVKPTIMLNWEAFAQDGILDGDFYLADLISLDNMTIKEKLNVLLVKTQYSFNRQRDLKKGAFSSSFTEFTDGQVAHQKFWSIYERPPQDEYQDYIINRRDLLVPQDVRERKGSFFTPEIWVELSQRYLADVFGVNWQDEYYIWDCAAGTGNLLVGLSNKYHIWASTLDKSDVDVMRDRIKNGANLLDGQVFQFDFLNDGFNKLPEGLQNIIKEKPDKLVIYINPPYAEAGSSRQLYRTRDNKTGVAISSKIYQKYKELIGNASNEIFAQFLIRIYSEIPNCKICHFSKLKALCGPNFATFREVFLAKLEKLFIAPADTFDNVSGQFPIGFHVWDAAIKEKFTQIQADVHDKHGHRLGKKTVCSYDNIKGVLNDWLKLYHDNNNNKIGVLHYRGSDFQNNNKMRISIFDPKNHTIPITKNNLLACSIYYTIRRIISSTWLNDRDLYLFPNEGWKQDAQFQSDCLVYAIFHNSNIISYKEGVNHWIPFTEYEVDAKAEFASHFMTDFITGKQSHSTDYIQTSIDGVSYERENTHLVFSSTGTAVLEAGRELWRYYHKQKDCNANASFYDIREHFQGRNKTGRMNSKSSDEMYNKLLNELRLAMKMLGKKIEPKVYEYGFLV